MEIAFDRKAFLEWMKYGSFTGFVVILAFLLPGRFPGIFGDIVFHFSSSVSPFFTLISVTQLAHTNFGTGSKRRVYERNFPSGGTARWVRRSPTSKSSGFCAGFACINILAWIMMLLFCARNTWTSA